MQTVTVEWLHSIDALKEVPDDQLQWLLDNSRHYIVPEGEYLFELGKPISGTHIIIGGNVRIFITQNNSQRDVTILEAKAITGHLPFSRGKVANAMGQAYADCQVMTFPIERSRELINTHFELTQALVHVMTTRVREFTALQQQNEKMMALGKLSAGLAHELNNPASAIVRDSRLLKKHLQLLPETFKDVISIKLTNEQVDTVNNRMFEVLGRKEKPVLSLKERTSQEERLNEWLEKKDIDNAMDIAENFTSYGFDIKDLESFHGCIPEQYLSPIFNWINNNLVTENMVNDIQEASQRISELVNSVKNFTHMDRASDKQSANIHKGIRNTITMLGHKLRKGNVELVEHFDEELPEVKAMIGELNQVWTNLIDNALDAMEINGKGVLEIKTVRDKEFVRVSIIDNGPGIPEEIRSRIFDPFFTTKEIGKGTGLGLDVVTRIVQQHRGVTKVNSVPGRTEFIVCFPISG